MRAGLADGKETSAPQSSIAAAKAGRRGRRPRTRGPAPRIVASRKETDG